MHLTHVTSFLLLAVSVVALLAAVWFAVRPPTTPPRRGIAWQTTQACFAALTATIGALCVLGALSLLN
jgi:hypothetical protein